jgi:hypothetical protein
VDIVTFVDPVSPQRSEPAPERTLSGRPELTIWNHFSDPSQQFFAGVWSATRGSWRVRYTEHEFCHLLEGRVAIISEAGRRWEFGRGDSFVVPAGFSGIWEVIEDCRKLYAVFEPRS